MKCSYLSCFENNMPLHTYLSNIDASLWFFWGALNLKMDLNLGSQCEMKEVAVLMNINWAAILARQLYAVNLKWTFIRTHLWRCSTLQGVMMQFPCRSYTLPWFQHEWRSLTMHLLLTNSTGINTGIPKNTLRSHTYL